MAVEFTFLGLRGYAYGACIALAALILLAVMALCARSKGLNAGIAGMFGVLAVPLGVIGARLLYCLVNLTDFVRNFENPMLMLHFFDGGMAMMGMVAGLLIAACLSAKISRARCGDVLDLMCLPFGLSVAVMRIGEQFTDLGVGKVVDESFATANLPWLFVQSRMGVAVEYRMNVWLYEAIAGVAIFVVAAVLWRRLKGRSGNTALLVLSLFGASQIMLESMRDDGHMLVIFLRIGQLCAAVLPFACSAILLRGAGARRKAATWIVLALCTAVLVVLEFSLDGRLTFGTPTLLRDYGIMTAACVAFAAMPVSLLFSRSRKA